MVERRVITTAHPFEPLSSDGGSIAFEVEVEVEPVEVEVEPVEVEPVEVEPRSLEK
jgi:hypothetical protein